MILKFFGLCFLQLFSSLFLFHHNLIFSVPLCLNLNNIKFASLLDQNEIGEIRMITVIVAFVFTIWIINHSDTAKMN